MRVGNVVKESKQPQNNQSPEEKSVPMVLDSEGDLPVMAQGVQDVASQRTRQALSPV